MSGGYLYLIQRKSGGAVKIGITRDLSHRIANLRQTTGYKDLVIRSSVWSHDPRRIERTLHQKLSDYALPDTGNGVEWFDDDAVVIDLVNQCMSALASADNPLVCAIKIMAIINPFAPDMKDLADIDQLRAIFENEVQNGRRDEFWGWLLNFDHEVAYQAYCQLE